MRRKLTESGTAERHFGCALRTMIPSFPAPYSLSWLPPPHGAFGSPFYCHLLPDKLFVLEPHPPPLLGGVEISTAANILIVHLGQGYTSSATRFVKLVLALWAIFLLALTSRLGHQFLLEVQPNVYPEIAFQSCVVRVQDLFKSTIVDVPNAVTLHGASWCSRGLGGHEMTS